MGDSDFFFPDEFPYDCASPVCSLDSDEDDKEDQAAKVDLGCSPQSTLCSHSDWEAQRLLQAAQMVKQEKMARRQAVVRALFLQPPTSSSTRESTGTGVFLPRVITVAPTEPTRKKPAAAAACSTVLLPARVVQALNLNLDEIGARPTISGGFILDKDAMRARTRQMQRTATNQSRALSPKRQNEGRLPPAWTY